MTTTTTSDSIPVTDKRRRVRPLVGFGVAFLISVLVAAIAGTGVIYAYQEQHAGRVLPGVRVGDVDVSGLDRGAVIAKLGERYGALANGKVVVTSTVARITIPYADFGRGPDLEGMADAALSVGRAGNPVDRAVAEVRTVVRGVDIEPWITFDVAGFASLIQRRLDGLALEPIDGNVTMGESGPIITPSRWGRFYDPATVTATAVAQLADLDAPAEIAVPAEFTTIRPTLDDTDTEIAAGAASRMATDVEIVSGKDTWQLGSAEVRKAVTFSSTPDGSFQPIVDKAALATVLGEVAKKARIAPTNASFLVGKGGAVVGVTAAKAGRDMNVPLTVDRIAEALAARAVGQTGIPVEPAFISSAPSLSTAEAEKAAPLMTRISTWTTYFPIGIKNGYGANIWIPSKLITGYIVGPGDTFSFWKAIGPVTRAKGYRDGGAIIDGHTEPTGALAGGICSCSTTLFNAALRAGLKMGQRKNHYYYIDRYPLGLDATVFKSSSGATTDMTFTNDTKYPILIRGINTRSGGKGYVRFDLYSVPTGRTVAFSTPKVRDVRPATTRVQRTSSLRAGTRQQIEYPVAGRKVWVTRTVRDKSGSVIHQETFYSNYKRVDGIILVGTG